MTKNRIRIICITMVLAMAVLGVVAFADGAQQVKQTAEDNSTVVRIDQMEKERNENGTLTDFTQNGPLDPAIYAADYGWTEDSEGFWENIKNARDKIVTVKNIGDTSAYFRTVIALEADQTDFDNLIKINLNMTNDASTGVHYYDWNQSVTGNDLAIIENVPITYSYDPYPDNDSEEVVTLKGNYDIIVGTYNRALEVGDTSAPSLLQVAMHKDAKYQQIKQFGNSYEILVATQAVKVEDESNPVAALEAKFGVISSANHPWSASPVVPDTPGAASEDTSATNENITSDTDDNTNN